ncbi:G-type lectin S-receptor-like serine/threonine-protein kinase [Camellia lanceoleosa]|uniref:G-type lectin S-receptor-like serine/threonine-protein kinase n=1 Tax=Camellia lanceoleosa TaxID=1840588 RepID=A0ACC0FL61_9ERIC|nr:G-type lectin S-receptor-like serine/threonine-protein kinase [Camellia lanceoleosa]
MLTDYNGTFITINAEEQPVPSNDTSATLLDTGNLVLRAGKHIVWQSFDYPSDTWLPGMKLGLFKSSRGRPQHRFLTSQVSPQVPTLGAFTLGVDPNNTKQLVIWQRGVLYWRSGMWNGYNFSYFPSSYDEFNFSYFSNESQSYFTFTRTDNDFPSWMDIGSSGNICIFKTEDNGWSVGGPYNCDDSQVQEYGYNLGCVAPNPSNRTAGDVFIKKSGSTNSWGTTTNNVSQGISDCKEICRQDCACTAYASALSDGSGCKFFYGEYSDSPEYFFYVRNISTANIASPLVAPSYPVTYMAPHNPNNLFPNDHNNTTVVNSRKKRLWFSISAAISSVIFTIVSSLSYLWWRNRHSRPKNLFLGREITSVGLIPDFTFVVTPPSCTPIDELSEEIAELTYASVLSCAAAYDAPPAGGQFIMYTAAAGEEETTSKQVKQRYRIPETSPHLPMLPPPWLDQVFFDARVNSLMGKRLL